jgi:glucosamine--fructose-6-phosphate aminotransferase (isomerizing)
MCGIAGYIGARPASPILLACLKQLEYRGYDSAGLGLQLADGIEVTRSIGRLVGLEAKLISQNGHAASARVGIGHTRWATHGRPSELNAHPQSSLDGKVVVVHNGIFENFLELRAEVSAYGLAPVSQTDTECFPLLVSMLMEQGLGFADAFRAAVQRVRGKYAVLCMHADHPDRILLARSGPTLVVGFGVEEYFVASDVAPLLPHTREIAYLEDGDVAELARDGLRVLDRGERSVERARTHIDWELGAVELNGHRHFMHKEIFEQPEALARTVEAYVDGDEVALGLPQMERVFRGLERIAIVACGTSWHAALVGKFLIEQLSRVPVDVDYASEFRYRAPIVSSKTLALAITQSGETADTVAALHEATSLGARTLVICNVIGSQIARGAEGALFTRAGPEIGVASTKAFTTQLGLLVLVALRIGRARGTLPAELAAEVVRGLRALPAQLERVHALESAIERLALDRVAATNALFLGRGSLYPIALEGALKLKEISYVHAEGLPAGELKHGPIALLEGHMPVIAVMPDDGQRKRMLSNLTEAAARGAKIVVFASEGERGLDTVAEAVLELPHTHPSLAPILYTVPLQLFAYHMARLRGLDVDRPRNLAKSVTVE